jgi:6-pyruvoyltetrahydropterin/6-carboxytetrahydropterin synthase
MFRLSKSFSFEASHQLPQHQGNCSRLHGHSWRCCLVVEGERLVGEGPKTGMLVDYADLGKITRGLHDLLDHRCLNDLIDNPTSERVALFVYQRAMEDIEAMGVRLAAVVVEETCTARCEYLLPQAV